MSMSARDVIMMEVRASLGASKQTKQAAFEIQADADALLDEPDAVRPALTSSDVVESFCTRATGPKVNATLDRVADVTEITRAIAAYLDGIELPLVVATAPHATLRALDWEDAGFQRVDTADDGVFIAIAQWAIAETGSVVFHSGAETPILSNFLAGTQIVVMPKSSIVGHLEDYIEAARASGDPAPRNACLVTGPSGTSDIEGAFVRGAHGPRNVHIIVVDTL
ncbi:MAG: LUD domain-containing protein [Pseudomonadota bacterium]